jgi:hypothetical protein
MPCGLASVEEHLVGEVREALVGEQPLDRRAAVAAPASRYRLDRMTPHDPGGAGRTLDAPQVRIDGRAVRPDGSWPGFAPTGGAFAGGQLLLELGGGEAAVVTLDG